MKLNLANKLTIFRIILVPLMVIVPYLNLQGDFTMEKELIIMEAQELGINRKNWEVYNAYLTSKAIQSKETVQTTYKTYPKVHSRLLYLPQLYPSLLPYHEYILQ